MSINPDDVPVEEFSTEGDDGESHHVPADLLELHEVLEWEKAVSDDSA